MCREDSSASIKCSRLSLPLNEFISDDPGLLKARSVPYIFPLIRCPLNESSVKQLHFNACVNKDCRRCYGQLLTHEPEASCVVFEKSINCVHYRSLQGSNTCAASPNGSCCKHPIGREAEMFHRNGEAVNLTTGLLKDMLLSFERGLSENTFIAYSRRALSDFDTAGPDVWDDNRPVEEIDHRVKAYASREDAKILGHAPCTGLKVHRTRSPGNGGRTLNLWRARLVECKRRACSSNLTARPCP